jgi:hypothetical protein
MDRESVVCPLCFAAVGEPCEFPEGPPWTVFDDGIQRRVVHAGRYAETLPQDERAGFWRGAVGGYLNEQLTARTEEGTDG